MGGWWGAGRKRKKVAETRGKCGSGGTEKDINKLRIFRGKIRNNLEE